MSQQHTLPNAVVGGIPTVDVDIPILSVLITIFIGLAAGHMTVLQLNQKRKHKFILSGLLFGFCMSRITACIMRLVWATRQTDANLTLAAQVFLNAGILLIYLANNLLAARLLRSTHPSIGWNPLVRQGHKALLYLLIPVIIMVIVTVVQSLKVTNLNTRRIDHDIQLAGLTYLLFIALLPFVLLAVVVFYPNTKGDRDHFGTGSWGIKVGLLVVTTALSCIEGGFRCGTSFEPQRPATNPAWFHSKAAFYCFNFVTEILIVSLFLAFRIDQRFHVRDKSNAPGDYSRKLAEDEVDKSDVEMRNGRHSGTA